MYEAGDKVFYYITVMNETYQHPTMPDGVEEGIVRGMYRLTPKVGRRQARSTAGQRHDSARGDRRGGATSRVRRASEIWSVTSFNELARDGMDVDRWNMLHPEETPRKSYVEQCLEGDDAPVVAATDYMKVYAEQIRAYVPAPYRVLGTDGFGRSDTREQLRSFFEVDRHFVTVAALASLADKQIIARSEVRDAMRRFDIEPEKSNPRLV